MKDFMTRTGISRDFRRRVKPDEAETRALIHAGALDSLDPTGDRTRLLWDVAHEKYLAVSAAVRS